MPNNATGRLEGRNGLIWQQHLAGWTQERIAEHHDIGQSRVSQIIADVRASIPEEERDAVRLTVVERLDVLIAEASAVMTTHHYVVSATGRVVEGPDGMPLRDNSPRLAAAKLISQLDAERRKLLGLDAPAKTEHSGKVATYHVTGVDLDALR